MPHRFQSRWHFALWGKTRSNNHPILQPSYVRAASSTKWWGWYSRQRALPILPSILFRERLREYQASNKAQSIYFTCVDMPLTRDPKPLRWLGIQVEPILNREGQTTHLMLTHKDLTHVKQTFTELKQTHDQLQQSLSASQPNCWVRVTYPSHVWRCTWYHVADRQ